MSEPSQSVQSRSRRLRLAAVALPILAGGAAALVALNPAALAGNGAEIAAKPPHTLMLLPENAGGPVGSVRREDLLVAYAKSEHMKAHYRELESARDAARGAGNDQLAAKVEAEGAEWQEVLHRQLTGDEPLYTTLLAVQEELRAVAAEHQLSRVYLVADKPEGLDLTDDLIKALAPKAE